MAEFEILPAIDLRAGRVVRLRQGDFDRETAYSDDPVATALELVERGSRWLHVVDLDGAHAGRAIQASLIANVIAAVRDSARVEVGGGIRDAPTAAGYLRDGVSRVVLGTAALRGDLAAEVIDSFGADRVVAAVDVRAGQAVGGGWHSGGGSGSVEATIDRLSAQGVETFEVTAIDCDGTLLGPDLPLLSYVRDLATRARVIASAGVRSIEDLVAVRGLGCSGAIVGRAIYERRLDLAAAVTAIQLSSTRTRASRHPPS